MSSNRVVLNNQSLSDLLYSDYNINYVRKLVLEKSIQQIGKAYDYTNIQCIKNLIESYSDEFIPKYGDMYSRLYHEKREIFSGGFTNNSIEHILQQVAQHIVDTIHSETKIEMNNSHLNRLNVTYGANNYNLNAHSKIKLREKHPQRMMFNMRF